MRILSLLRSRQTKTTIGAKARASHIGISDGARNRQAQRPLSWRRCATYKTTSLRTSLMLLCVRPRPLQQGAGDIGLENSHHHHHHHYKARASNGEFDQSTLIKITLNARRSESEARKMSRDVEELSAMLDDDSEASNNPVCMYETRSTRSSHRSYCAHPWAACRAARHEPGAG